MCVKILWLDVHEPDIIKMEDSVLPDGFEVVRPRSSTDTQEHLRLLKDVEYIITGGTPVPRAYIEAAKNLKMIQKWGVGVDNIDHQAAEEKISRSISPPAQIPFR